MLSNTKIRIYKKGLDKEIFEKFRSICLLEGNESLTEKKIDPENFDGAIWLAFENEELASVSAIERSHYTENSDVARICRYHIQKKFRHGRYGFKILPQQFQWAVEHKFKLIYWTHNSKAKALNELYQKKRRFYSNTDHYFDCPIFNSFHLNKNYLFKDSPNSNILQFIYESKLEPDFIWKPQKSVISMNLALTHHE